MKETILVKGKECSAGAFALTPSRDFSFTSRSSANPLDFISATIDEATKKKKDETTPKEPTEAKKKDDDQEPSSKIRAGATAKFVR